MFYKNVKNYYTIKTTICLTINHQRFNGIENDTSSYELKDMFYSIYLDLVAQYILNKCSNSKGLHRNACTARN